MNEVNAQSSEHHLRINGANLYYKKTGKGQPVLLLHGWTQSASFWDPYLPALSKQYEVYSIDLRGHGHSSPLNSDFSIALSARDVIRLIDTLGLENVRAIGLSFGGLILLEICRMRKDLIGSMVLIGTSYHYDGAASEKGKPAFRYEDLDAGFKAYLHSQHQHGESQIRALFDPALDYKISLSIDDLRSFTARTLIINGDADHIADLRQVVEMKNNIPNALLWIIPGTGHMALTDEVRDEFIRRTLAFF